MIKRLAIIGVGLIGGSFARALRAAGLVAHIVGSGRSRENLEHAVQLGVIDAIAESPADAVRQADLVLLAVPVGSLPDIFRAIHPVIGKACLVTDAGSTKQDVVRAAQQGLGDKVAQFIPGHPIAGAENSGVAAAQGDLFQGRKVILTPLPENTPEAVQRVTGLWQACGATVDTMDAATHDRVFAAVSHLPHLAAFALVDELAGRKDAALYFDYAGSGFRDFTRIAGSHPEMWRDIALANSTSLLAELDAYIKALQQLRSTLSGGDGARLEEIFRRASAARQNWNKHS